MGPGNLQAKSQEQTTLVLWRWAAAGFKDALLRVEIAGGSWLQDGNSATN